MSGTRQTLDKCMLSELTTNGYRMKMLCWGPRLKAHTESGVWKMKSRLREDPLPLEKTVKLLSAWSSCAFHLAAGGKGTHV